MDGIPLTSKLLQWAESLASNCPLFWPFSSFLRWRISSKADNDSVEDLGQGRGGGGGGGGGGGAAQRGVDVRAGGDIRVGPGTFWGSIRPVKSVKRAQKDR